MAKVTQEELEMIPKLIEGFTQLDYGKKNYILGYVRALGNENDSKKYRKAN